MAAHFMHSWSPNDNLYPPPQTEAEDASLMVVGAEVHVDHPIAGNGYLGYSYIDAADIMPLGDGIQVIHGSTGPVFKENYFGAQPREYLIPPTTFPLPVNEQGPFDDTGTVQTILFQYIFRVGRALGKKPEELDLNLAVFGMYNHISAPKVVLGNTIVPKYTLEQDRLKFGAELQFGLIRWLVDSARASIA